MDDFEIYIQKLCVYIYVKSCIENEEKMKFFNLVLFCNLFAKFRCVLNIGTRLS